MFSDMCVSMCTGMYQGEEQGPNLHSPYFVDALRTHQVCSVSAGDKHCLALTVDGVVCVHTCVIEHVCSHVRRNAKTEMQTGLDRDACRHVMDRMYGRTCADDRGR